MSQKIKRMDIKEFREFVFLQELNRQFLHPLGLALEVIIDKEDDSEKLGGIWDFRDDPEGMCFGEGVIVQKEQIQKAERVQKFWDIKTENRKKKLGYVIQPIGRKINFGT